MLMLMCMLMCGYVDVYEDVHMCVIGDASVNAIVCDWGCECECDCAVLM